MPIYRYRIISSGSLDEHLQRLTPGDFNIIAINGATTVDIMTSSGGKDDIDSAMSQLGLSEVFQVDPIGHSGVVVETVKDNTVNCIARWNGKVAISDSLAEVNDAGDLAISGVYKIGENPLSIDNLADVDTTTKAPQMDDVLGWSGTEWMPRPSGSPGGGGGASELDELSDVSTAGAASGDYLHFNGSQWSPGPVKEYQPSNGNPVGITPSAGDKYYDTGINHEMRYDASRSKWLSVATFYEGAGRNGTTTAGTFYRRFNGMIETTVLGGAVLKGTIVYVGQTRLDTDAATLEVLLGASVITTQASSATLVQDATVNADFIAGSMSFRNETGGNDTTSLQASAHYKLRA